MDNKKEVTYEITMKIVRGLLKSKIIKEDEFNKFKEEMIKKYNPKISLLMELSLDK